MTLEELKAELRITSDDLDPPLAALLAGVEAEARQFIGRDFIPDEPDVRQGLVMLARSQFDAATPDEAMKFRRVAETLLQPHRVGMGL